MSWPSAGGAVVSLLLAVSLVGCATEDEPVECFVGADATSVADVADMEDLLAARVPGFVSGCARVTGVVITGHAAGDGCWQPPRDLLLTAPDPRAQAAARQAAHQEVVSDAVAAYQCGQQATSKGSDLLGLLSAIHAQAAPGAGVRVLLITDGMQNTTELSLYDSDVTDPGTHTATRQQAVAALGDLSDWQQITLDGAGLGTTTDPARRRAERDWWSTVLLETGATPDIRP